MAHRRPDSAACLCTASGSRPQLFPHPIDLFANHPSRLLAHPQTLPEALFEASRFAKPTDAQSKGLRGTGVCSRALAGRRNFHLAVGPPLKLAPAACPTNSSHDLQCAPCLRLRHQQRCLKFISRFHLSNSHGSTKKMLVEPYLLPIPSLYHLGKPVTEHAWVARHDNKQKKNHHKGYSRSLNRSNSFAPVHLLNI